MELAPAHVDGEHGGGPGLEQAVGEPAGGGAGIERPEAGDVDGEAIQGRSQLLPSPSDERRGRAGELDGLVRRHQPGRFVGHRSRHQDPALGDEGCRLGTGLDQAPLDQRLVEPTPRRPGQPADPVPGVDFLAAVLAADFLAAALVAAAFLPAAFLAGDFLAAAFLAAGFLVAVALALVAGAFLAAVLVTRLGAPLGGRPAGGGGASDQGGDLLGQVLEIGDAGGVELAGHLVAHLGHQQPRVPRRLRSISSSTLALASLLWNSPLLTSSAPAPRLGPGSDW